MNAFQADFLPLATQMGRLIAVYDWSQTPLGPIADWPQSLKSITAFLVGSPVPMVMLWGEAGIMIYNDGYSEFAGDRHPDQLGCPVREGWPEVASFNDNVVKVGLAGGTLSYRDQHMLLNRRGHPEPVWMNLDYSPVFDESGKPAGVLAIVIETTDKILAENRNAAEHKRLTLLFEQAPGFMAIMRGPEHIYELGNNAYLQLLGQRDLIGRSVRAAVPELAGQGMFELLDHVYSSGQAFVGNSLRVELQRGGIIEERFVDCVFQPIVEAGRVSGIFIEGADVTERKRAELALLESENQFRMLANSIPQLAWRAAADGSILWFNTRWYDYTGTTLDTMSGKSWYKLIHPDQRTRVATEVRCNWISGVAWELACQLRGANGEYRWFLTAAQPILDDGGRVAQWFGTNTDITGQRALQEELQQLAASLAGEDQRKDEFLATLAHELRNPLAPIRTGLEVMKMVSNDPLRVEDLRATLERQTRQLITLVDDLLDVSRIKQGKMKLRRSPVLLQDIVQIARETSMPHIIEAEHRLSIVIPEQPVYLNADKQRLAQVLSNLLNNAAHYTPPGGAIGLTAILEDAELCIAVSDSGMGIDAGKLQSIFEMYAQNDPLGVGYRGLGIGLALARHLVEMHEGRIEVRSEGIDRGSEFRVYLPVLIQHEAALLPPAFSASTAVTAARRVLIVDDNTAAADTLSMFVSLLGYEVQTAEDGARAVELAERFEPHVVLMDLGMPVINGYEAARLIRQQPWSHATVLVALSGWGQDEDKQRTRAAGFDHHLVKPAELAELQLLLASARRE